MPFQKLCFRSFRWGRQLAIALLFIFLGFGGIGFSGQWAIAASTTDVLQADAPQADAPQSDAYDAGPIRKSRNPISNENFQGGVDLQQLEEEEGTSDAVPESGKNLIDTLKEFVPGTSSNTSDNSVPSVQDTSPQSYIEPECNPTLERYTDY